MRQKNTCILQTNVVLYYLRLINRHAPVAQLDRVSDYESEGREFESLPARHRKEVSTNSTYLFSITREQRKRRNREFKEVALDTTLNDHVSNGECAERGARSRSERGQKQSGGLFLTRAQQKRMTMNTPQQAR